MAVAACSSSESEAPAPDPTSTMSPTATPMGTPSLTTPRETTSPTTPTAIPEGTTSPTPPTTPMADPVADARAGALASCVSREAGEPTTAAPAPAGETVYVEGVGEVEGPVAIFLVAETESLALHQRIAAVVEPHQLLLGTRIASPFDWDRLPWDQLPATLFTAVDLSSGARWPLEGVSSPVVLARDRLVAWDDESIRRLALDGQVEAVLFQPGRPFSDPILSPTGLLIAVTTTGSVPQAMGRVVIIELHSGEEVLCVREEDTPIAEIARMLEVDSRHLELEIVRWSTDGSALWVQAMLNSFPVAHVVIELGGTVHTYPSLEVRSSSEQVFAFAFSPDLRFLVRGRLHERGLGFTERFEDGTPYLRSLEVVEVSTGRELAAITADANTLVHLVGPVDGRVEFARFPEDDQGVPVYVLEVATGAVVRQDDPDPWRETRRAEFSEEHAEHNLAILGHCFETRLDLQVCHDTVEEAVEMADSYRLESPTGREIWRLIGITWLD